jgi:hypothetical protein
MSREALVHKFPFIPAVMDSAAAMRLLWFDNAKNCSRLRCYTGADHE